MKKYRIIQDCFSGYEAQVKYVWIPLIWFQLNDFFWINTWKSPELAKTFIELKKAGTYIQGMLPVTGEDHEFEKESKVLLYKRKRILPIVVWEERSCQVENGEKRKWGPVFNSKWVIINKFRF